MTGGSGSLVLELTCTLDASRERIFKALTDPSELVKWWGPSGFTTPVIETDLSIGGGYRLGMQPPDGELFYLAGEFLEIDPPSRLAFTFRWEEPDPDDRETVVRVSLDDVAERDPAIAMARRVRYRGAAGAAQERLDRFVTETVRTPRVRCLTTRAGSALRGSRQSTPPSPAVKRCAPLGWYLADASYRRLSGRLDFRAHSRGACRAARARS